MVRALLSVKLAPLPPSTLTGSYPEFEPLSSKRTCCHQVVEPSVPIPVEALQNLELVARLRLKTLKAYEWLIPLSSKGTCCRQVVEPSVPIAIEALQELELVALFSLKALRAH